MAHANVEQPGIGRNGVASFLRGAGNEQSAGPSTSTSGKLAGSAHSTMGLAGTRPASRSSASTVAAVQAP
jgi:hypothetical protein